ncbi:MAG: hypothetical protein K2I88_04810 [Anaeroplasmataceae bacterium]|nr:hypothetical protein [Anaeroplasmataceae bacterium]
MELIHKSLRRDEWERFIKKNIKTVLVDEKGFCGTVGLLTIEEIEKPLVITYPNYQVTIADKNYKWLQFAPKNENWWLTVLYDNEDHFIEAILILLK